MREQKYKKFITRVAMFYVLCFVVLFLFLLFGHLLRSDTPQSSRIEDHCFYSQNQHKCNHECYAEYVAESWARFSAGRE
jgi:hypothetical protein